MLTARRLRLLVRAICHTPMLRAFAGIARHPLAASAIADQVLG
jgi:hypothetical protein